VLLVAPSPGGLEQARQGVLSYLGWEEVRAQLQKQDLANMDPLRWQILLGKRNAASKAVPGAIRQAYTTVVTMSETGAVEAFKVTVGEQSLFATIVADARARVQETAISAEALLPGGPYELWREGETSRWLKDLADAFAQHPHLPKMLNRGAILDTLVQGCLEGTFVFRLQRPDGSACTFWRERPEDALLKEPAMEVILPEAATLSGLLPALLAPGALPELWEGEELALQALHGYFAGGHVVHMPKEGYQEVVPIPAAPRHVVDEAVRDAVQGGRLWLLSGPASIWSEEIPPGMLTPTVHLYPPPSPVSPIDLLQANLPEAWEGGETTALSIAHALSGRAGVALPWPVVRKALDGAFNYNYLERTVDSGPWPCTYAGAANVRVRVSSEPKITTKPETKPGVRVAEADLETHELQDLADVVGDLKKAAAGYELKIHVRIELGGNPPEEVVEKVNGVLEGVAEKLRIK